MTERTLVPWEPDPTALAVDPGGGAGGGRIVGVQGAVVAVAEVTSGFGNAEA
jgi:hypothetical protein